MNDPVKTATPPPLTALWRFYLLSLLLVSVPLPFLLALQFFSAGIRNCVVMFFAWLALAVAYWRPVGTVLFLWKRGWLARLLVGYLVSLPLYFFCLLMIYPAFGAHFHPRSPALWVFISRKLRSISFSRCSCSC
jgi:hypothetical protein